MGIRSLLRKVFGRDRADQHEETPATSVPPQADRATSDEPVSVTLPSPADGERARAATPAETGPKESAAQRAADDLVAAAFDNPKVPGARSAEAPEATPAEAEAAEAEAEAAEAEAAEATPAEAQSADAAPVEVQAAEAEAPEATPADAEAQSAEAPEAVATEAEPEAAVAAEPEAEPEAETVAPEAEVEAEAKPETAEAEVETEVLATDAATMPQAEEVAEAEAVAEPEPETAPVTDEATPEPEPEAAPVADEATPEPEPETAPVTDEATPEPEPEAAPAADAQPAVAAAIAEEPVSESAPVAEEPVSEAPAPKAAPATTLARVKADAPNLVDAYKAAGAALKKQGLVGARAAVYLVVDRSGSMRGYFKDGSVQRIAEQTVALAAHLDEDATVTAVFFSTDIDGTAELRPQGLEGRIDEINAGLGRLGRTNYHRAVEEVLAHHEKADPTRPAFVVFQTDGAPESKTAATQALAQAADRPIHWQFVAWGEEDNKAFDFLRKLTAPRTGHFLAGVTPSETAHSAFYGGLLADWQI